MIIAKIYRPHVKACIYGNLDTIKCSTFYKLDIVESTSSKSGISDNS